MGNPLLATVNDISLKKFTATLHKKRHSGRQKGILDFNDFHFINHLLQQHNKVQNKPSNSSATLLKFDKNKYFANKVFECSSNYGFWVHEVLNRAYCHRSFYPISGQRGTPSSGTPPIADLAGGTLSSSTHVLTWLGGGYSIPGQMVPHPGYPLS